MFDRIRQFVLTIRPAKLYVAAKEVTILGYTLKQGKIMSELFLVDNIMPILFPKAKKQVRCLLDLINCYGVLVAKYIDIVASHAELTAGKTANDKIKWAIRHTDALRDIQRTPNSKPFPRIPDLTKDLYIFTDSSAVGIAGCMAMISEGQYLPNKYLNRKLSPTVARWAIQKTRRRWLSTIVLTN